MKISREELLKQLESVSPGLSTREIIEQSSCFVFQDKTVVTYNDEIACWQKCVLDIKGAVQAKPLIDILRKLSEKNLDINVSPRKDELLIKGKRRRAGIQMEKDLLLPIEAVDMPKKWHALPSNFVDAIKLVQPCAGSKETEFNLTCIHLHPKWIEACDNHQATRFKIKIGIMKPTLIRKDSLKHIIDIDVKEFSETKHWIHFRNPDGLILSCRYWVEKYPDLADILKMKGEPLTLPKGLKETIEKAEVFTAENVEGDNVIVSLQPGRFELTGRGVLGWFTERKETKYNGRSLNFTIPAKTLIELVNEYNECEVSKNRLRVKGNNFVYITVLGKAKNRKHKEDD